MTWTSKGIGAVVCMAAAVISCVIIIILRHRVDAMTARAENAEARAAAATETAEYYRKSMRRFDAVIDTMTRRIDDIEGRRHETHEKIADTAIHDPDARLWLCDPVPDGLRDVLGGVCGRDTGDADGAVCASTDTCGD